MPGTSSRSGVGVCIVRAETDASAGTLITVTARPDIDDPARESVLHTPAPDVALARVAEFLAALECDAS
jgi:hypothetical protein